MTTPGDRPNKKARITLDLLREVESEIPPDEEKLIDLQDWLEKWSAGVITRDEHAAIMAHLVNSPDDRQFVDDMIEDGSLELPRGLFEDEEADESNDEDQGPDAESSSDEPSIPLPTPAERPAPGSQFNRRIVYALFAAAACIVIGLLLRGLFFNDRLPGSPLLAQGENGYIDHYLSDSEFVGLQGGSFIKDLDLIPGSNLPPERQQEHERRRRASQDNPDDVTLLLNYGQVLLEDRLDDEALEVFARAVQQEPANNLASLGLGIAQFRAGEIAQARDIFNDLLTTAPELPVARINLTVCLVALGELGQAREIWRAVPDSLRDSRVSVLVRE